MFPEISKSVATLLESLNNDASSNRVFSPNPPYRSRQSSSYQTNKPFRSASNTQSYVKRSCDYCKLTGKKAFHTHNISNCLFIKRERSANAKQVECEDEDDELLKEQYEEFYQLTGDMVQHDADRVIEHFVSVVNISASPVFTLMKDNKSYNFILDTGCTGNIIPKATATALNATIHPTLQRARGADGKQLNIIGETNITLYRGDKPYHLATLVCGDHTDLLAGMPFLRENDIGIRPATNQIIIDGKEFIHYDPVRKWNPAQANRVTQVTIQSTSRQVILPGESGIFSIEGIPNGESILVEPRWDAHCNKATIKDRDLWPIPQITSVSNGFVMLPNMSSEPVVVKKAEVIGNIHPRVEIQSTDISVHSDESVKEASTFIGHLT